MEASRALFVARRRVKFRYYLLCAGKEWMKGGLGGVKGDKRPAFAGTAKA